MKQSNSVFNLDEITIKKVNYHNLAMTLFLVILIIGILIFFKKNYYYKNMLIKDKDSIFLVVDKEMVDVISDSKKIIVNKISSGYSINKIIDYSDICYVEIMFDNNITNIQNTEYQLLLGKETIFEYFIRIIKKI